MIKKTRRIKNKKYGKTEANMEMKNEQRRNIKEDQSNEKKKTRLRIKNKR